MVFQLETLGFWLDESKKAKNEMESEGRTQTGREGPVRSVSDRLPGCSSRFYSTNTWIHIMEADHQYQFQRQKL